MSTVFFRKSNYQRERVLKQHHPAVTLTKNNRLSIPKNTYQKFFKEFDRAYLGYNPDTQQLIIKPTIEKNEDTFKITPVKSKQKNGKERILGHSIPITPFLKHFNIETPESYKRLKIEEKNGELYTQPLDEVQDGVGAEDDYDENDENDE